MAYWYEKTIKISVRDSCGSMGAEGSDEYLDRIAKDILMYVDLYWPGIKIEIVEEK